MNKSERFKKRKKKVRAKIVGTKSCPRLSVFRSNRYIYAQLINDELGVTLAAVCEKDLRDKKPSTKSKQSESLKKYSKLDRSALVGELLATKAKKKKIKKVVFDKSGYKYHGRVKALADGARKGGLEF